MPFFILEIYRLGIQKIIIYVIQFSIQRFKYENVFFFSIQNVIQLNIQKVMIKMVKLKILNRKIVKQGESHFVYIPRAYFNNGQLSVNEIYDIIIIIPQKKTVKDTTTQKPIETITEEI